MAAVRGRSAGKRYPSVRGWCGVFMHLAVGVSATVTSYRTRHVKRITPPSPTFIGGVISHRKVADSP